MTTKDEIVKTLNELAFVEALVDKKIGELRELAGGACEGLNSELGAPLRVSGASDAWTVVFGKRQMELLSFNCTYGNHGSSKRPVIASCAVKHAERTTTLWLVQSGPTAAAWEHESEPTPLRVDELHAMMLEGAKTRAREILGPPNGNS